MNPVLTILEAAFLLMLFGTTWWYAKSTSRLLKQAQVQVTAIEGQAIAKIAELQDSYTHILKEIEERRQAEQRLKESEARFAAFMRHVPGTAVIMDPTGAYLFANETWERVFGTQPGEGPGEMFPTLELAGSGQVWEELNRRVIEEGHPLERVETLWRNGKTQFWLVTRFPIPQPEGFTPLVGAIGIDITARREAEEALRESEHKLRALAGQLLTAQENERKRLAAELHDELGHTLLTLKLRMESLKEELTPQQSELKREMNGILNAIGDTIAEVRRLYLDLTPGDLEDLGLTGALHSLIEEFRTLKKTVGFTVELENVDGLFPITAQTAIYRVVQEALTNIGKHADPQHISLAVHRDHHRVSFLIEDDGRGFDTKQVFSHQKTLGLLAMEERIRILGGTFELLSRPGQGTRIAFHIPHQGGPQE